MSNFIYRNYSVTNTCFYFDPRNRYHAKKNDCLVITIPEKLNNKKDRKPTFKSFSKKPKSTRTGNSIDPN